MKDIGWTPRPSEIQEKMLELFKDNGCTPSELTAISGSILILCAMTLEKDITYEVGRYKLTVEVGEYK